MPEPPRKQILPRISAARWRRRLQPPRSYSEKLIKGAETVFAFARDGHRRNKYSTGAEKDYIEPYYNSTGHYDEYIWGAAWLYYATGNSSYLKLATNQLMLTNAGKEHNGIGIVFQAVLSWDNKLPAAMLLLARYRIFLNPGYPYEEMLKPYYDTTMNNMCSYFQQYHTFNWTRGGY